MVELVKELGLIHWQASFIVTLEDVADQSPTITLKLLACME